MGMTATDELRKYAQDWRENPNLMDDLDAGDIDGLLGDFEHIADSIDAEHERLMAERRRSCVFYDAERNYCKVHDEGDMAELGYVRLPVDTDGVPIRIGDVMEWPDTTTAEVVGVGNGTFFYVEVGENVVEWARTCDKIHHVQESVEDVLRDVVTLCHNTWKEGSAFEFYDVDDVMKSGNIAEYAAKLRLAESEDA